MHFEILVEDASGKIALESVLEKILGPNGQDHTYKIISYKGIGRIPKDLRGKTDPQKRILLDRLRWMQIAGTTHPDHGQLCNVIESRTLWGEVRKKLVPYP